MVWEGDRGNPVPYPIDPHVASALGRFQPVDSESQLTPSLRYDCSLGANCADQSPARFLPFTAGFTTLTGHSPINTRRTSLGAPA